MPKAKAKAKAAAAAPPNTNTTVKHLEAEVRKQAAEIAKPKKSGAQATELEEDEDEAEPVGGSGHSKATIEAIISEYDVDIRNTIVAEKTSVDKPRHAAKLVVQKAEREAYRVQLRNLQTPEGSQSEHCGSDQSDLKRG